MSMTDYEIAKQRIFLLSQTPSFSGPQATSLVLAAQNRLQVNFPPTYLRFLSDFGAGGIGSFEIYGVTGKDFESAGIPDVVWYTEKARKEWNLPKDLLPIYDLGDGEVFCLDMRKVEPEIEASVIAFSPGVPVEKQCFDVLSKDFGAFFLLLVTQEEKRVGIEWMENSSGI